MKCVLFSVDRSVTYGGDKDAWNRPVEFKDGSTVVVKYEYDGLNRRIAKIFSSSEYHYYSQSWQVLETVKTVGSTDTLYEQLIWHPHYVDALALRAYDGGSGQVSHYALQDGNFNVVALTNTSGSVVERYDYTPYGELEVLDADFSADGDGNSDFKNRYTYTGRRFDAETDIYYFRNRYYHAQLGRFTSRDPIGYEGSPWNLYEFLEASPLIGVDPSGKSFKDLWEILKRLRKRKKNPPKKLPDFRLPPDYDACMKICEAPAKTPAEAVACVNLCKFVKCEGKTIFCNTLGSLCGKFKTKKNLEVCYSMCLANCAPTDCVRP